MKDKVKYIIYLILGWGFIILGIIGLFLPILQGILFIIIGLFFLSKGSKRARKLLLKLRQRYPEVYKKFDQLKYKIKGKIKK